MNLCCITFGCSFLLQYLPHLSVYGPFKKAAAGYRITLLLNTRGQVILMGMECSVKNYPVVQAFWIVETLCFCTVIRDWHTTMFMFTSLGKFYDNAGISEPEIVQFPGNERAVDVQTGSGYILALTESGSVYTWGKNSTTSYEVCVQCRRESLYTMLFFLASSLAMKCLVTRPIPRGWTHCMDGKSDKLVSY